MCRWLCRTMHDLTEKSSWRTMISMTPMALNTDKTAELKRHQRFGRTNPARVVQSAYRASGEAQGWADEPLYDHRICKEPYTTSGRIAQPGKDERMRCPSHQRPASNLVMDLLCDPGIDIRSCTRPGSSRSDRCRDATIRELVYED